MSIVTIEDTNLTNIANAIRNKNGTSTKYKPSEMAGAIESISGSEDLTNEFNDYETYLTTQETTIEDIIGALENKTGGETGGGNAQMLTKAEGEWFNISDLIVEMPDLDASNFEEITLSDMPNLTKFPNINIPDATSLYISGLTKITEISGLDTSNCEIINLSDMPNLTKFPNLDTSNVKEIEISGLTKITEISGLDTSTATSITISDMENLSEIPNLDYTSATQITISGMPKITETSNLNLPACKILYISDMENLVTVGELTNYKPTNPGHLFSNNPKLTTIPVIDFSNVSSIVFEGGIFSNWAGEPSCPSLSDESLNNFLASLLTIQQNIMTKTLSEMGLDENQVARCQTLSNWEALQAKGWSA